MAELSQLASLSLLHLPAINVKWNWMAKDISRSLKNAAKPFHVKTQTQDIEVLGTHFNVNAYADEAAVKDNIA